ncbi:MAG: hypothetical protein ABJN46_09810, partial [Marinobacter sp.]|uniref:hypothetical protein n=1 Tax=Marinobacter sp. TaxID=50741 RepID=UPI003298C590
AALLRGGQRAAHYYQAQYMQCAKKFICFVGSDSDSVSVDICLGRKANIQADRPALTFGEIQPLFWHVRSNGVEPMI